MVKVSKEKKREIRGFFNRFEASRPIKGRLADAYYAGGIAQLVGRISSFVYGLKLIEMLVAMIETLPAPEEATLKELLRSGYFDGSVLKTSRAIRETWLVDANLAICPEHGLTRPAGYYEPSHGTVNDDGSRDITGHAYMECGCDMSRQHYHNEDRPRPWER